MHLNQLCQVHLKKRIILLSRFFGGTAYTSILSNANNFEVTIVDDFKCRVSTIIDNLRYYLVVTNDTDLINENGVPYKPVLLFRKIN